MSDNRQPLDPFWAPECSCEIATTCQKRGCCWFGQAVPLNVRSELISNRQPVPGVYGPGQETEQASGWRDIATAPKDGAEVLVYGPEDGVCVAVTGLPWAEGMWISASEDRVDPTHWMPLPEPPK